jgi:hypothetical protein
MGKEQAYGAEEGFAFGHPACQARADRLLFYHRVHSNATRVKVASLAGEHRLRFRW